MNLELINPHTMKILIAARREDSIRSISNRIGLSYGWTYKWIQDLARVGVFRLTRMKIYLDESNSFYRETLKYIRTNFSKDTSFYYSVLNLFGIKHCFTQTDAVFIWTNGGYNISRYRDFYPIFIKVGKRDKKLFEEYCKKLNLSINSKRRSFYHVYYLDNFDLTYYNGIPVDALEETISFMKEHIYNFEPALEMIKEIHKKRINVKYKEAITNV